MNKSGTIILLAGPSGVGKSTFVNRLTKDFEIIRDIVTCTTRPQRQGEIKGKDYSFLSVDKFKELVTDDYFAEWATVHDSYYGTPVHELEKYWAQDMYPVIDIDIQGVQSLKEKYPKSISIFILPPSVGHLRERILKRDPETSEENIKMRMKTTEKELQTADACDHQVINEDIEDCYTAIKNILNQKLEL